LFAGLRTFQPHAAVLLLFQSSRASEIARAPHPYILTRDSDVAGLGNLAALQPSQERRSMDSDLPRNLKSRVPSVTACHAHPYSIQHRGLQ
jgi:hypothetical protein